MTQFALNTRDILEMLQYARPHGSRAEADFVNRFVSPLPGLTWDKYGNGIVRIGTAPILWSCHTDTVHKKDGKQTISLDKNIIRLSGNVPAGAVLGADDAAGIWLMSQMIRADVPGLYLFHAGEEVGGLGSSWLAENTPDLLRGISYAIALDRKGQDSVITHQGARCCSDEFAVSLAKKLGGKFAPDSTGLFTDTANYTDLIGECSNISVGYEGAHSAKETLDLAFLCSLGERLITFDCSALVCRRSPGEIDHEYEASLTIARYATAGYGRDKSLVYDEYEDRYGPGASNPWNDSGREEDEDLIHAEMEDLCFRYPQAVAEMLRELGINDDDLRDYVRGCGYQP